MMELLLYLLATAFGAFAVWFPLQLAGRPELGVTMALGVAIAAAIFGVAFCFQK